jgi:hypothetical protein
MKFGYYTLIGSIISVMGLAFPVGAAAPEQSHHSQCTVPGKGFELPKKLTFAQSQYLQQLCFHLFMDHIQTITEDTVIKQLKEGLHPGETQRSLAKEVNDVRKQRVNHLAKILRHSLRDNSFDEDAFWKEWVSVESKYAKRLVILTEKQFEASSSEYEALKNLEKEVDRVLLEAN